MPHLLGAELGVHRRPPLLLLMQTAPRKVSPARMPQEQQTRTATGPS